MKIVRATHSWPRDTGLASSEPLTVSNKEAQRLLGIGKTKYWDLVAEGAIETVQIGRTRMPTYASLKRLAGQS
jgi:hypothetical protein